VVNLSDAVNEGTVDPSDFTVNGIPADSRSFSNGDLTITFTFNSTPVVNQGEQTMNIPQDAFTRQSDNQGVFEFNCTFRYDVTLLAVTDTVPPVGGTFTPPAPGSYEYDVNWNEAVDPSSVSISDLQLSGNTFATVTNVTVSPDNMTTIFTLNITFGGNLTAEIPAGAITDAFGNPNADFSGSYTVEGIEPCLWSAGPDLPFAGTRFGGVFFPANGKFYAMGGRDATNVEFTHPFEYDPVSNTWTTKAASYPDTHVSNIECAVANDSGTDYIYCVGGSEFASQTSTGRVFRYDPVADVITTVPANWTPGDNNVLPGGISVFSNKIYILGGFNINTSVTDEIWELTPNPAGWMLKNAHLLVPRAYVPTTTIGNFIYTGGGADWDGVTLQDTTDSFKYDPVADSISPIASIPRATSNTRALNFCDQMYVMGGAFNLISNEVDVYDPVSDTWSIGTPFVTARRNSATDTDGTGNIWLAGGYDASLAIIASTESFNCPISPCGAPTPTPTPTPTATPTPPPSPTPRETRTPRPRPTPHPRP
jgi:N-acetylneuraminic acid mutarotase